MCSLKYIYKCIEILSDFNIYFVIAQVDVYADSLQNLTPAAYTMYIDKT